MLYLDSLVVVVDGAKLRGIASTSKQTLKTAVSPKKIAMYTAKLANVGKTVIINTLRTVGAGVTSYSLNVARRLLTGSTVGGYV